MNERRRMRSATGAVPLRAVHAEHDLFVGVGEALDDLARGRLDVLAAAADAGTWQRVGRYSRAGERVKDAVDRLAALAGLTLLGPFMIVLAAVIRADSAGPALIEQTRIGRGGHPFRLWRFRTMHTDARHRHPELFAHGMVEDAVRGLHLSPAVDPRVTRLGGFLRRTHLDELPGLLNLLVGEMSVVGPRPEIPELVPYCGSSAKLVLSVKPGLV